MVDTCCCLPTHLQEEDTQGLERAAGQGGRVSHSRALQNETHLLARQDTAAPVSHKLAPREKPQTTSFTDTPCVAILKPSAPASEPGQGVAVTREWLTRHSWCYSGPGSGLPSL